MPLFAMSFANQFGLGPTSNLENQLNNMFNPDESGNVSFNVNSLQQLVSQEVNINSDPDFGYAVDKFRISHYMLIIIIGILVVLYLFKNRRIFSEILTNGQ